MLGQVRTFLEESPKEVVLVEASSGRPLLASALSGGLSLPPPVEAPPPSWRLEQLALLVCPGCAEAFFPCCFCRPDL